MSLLREFVMDVAARIVAAVRESVTELGDRVEEERARIVSRQAREAPGLAEPPAQDEERRRRQAFRSFPHVDTTKRETR